MQAPKGINYTRMPGTYEAYIVVCDHILEPTALSFKGRTTWSSFLFYFFHPIYECYPRPSFSVSPLVVTQIRGHIAGSSRPLPTTVRALHFYREKISAVSSLVDSRRIVLIHARRSQQLLTFFI